MSSSSWYCHEFSSWTVVRVTGCHLVYQWCHDFLVLCALSEEYNCVTWSEWRDGQQYWCRLIKARSTPQISIKLTSKVIVSKKNLFVKFMSSFTEKIQMFNNSWEMKCIVCHCEFAQKESNLRCAKFPDKISQSSVSFIVWCIKSENSELKSFMFALFRLP